MLNCLQLLFCPWPNFVSLSLNSWRSITPKVVRNWRWTPPMGYGVFFPIFGTGVGLWPWYWQYFIKRKYHHTWELCKMALITMDTFEKINYNFGTIGISIFGTGVDIWANIGGSKKESHQTWEFCIMALITLDTWHSFLYRTCLREILNLVTIIILLLPWRSHRPALASPQVKNWMVYITRHSIAPRPSGKKKEDQKKIISLLSLFQRVSRCCSLPFVNADWSFPASGEDRGHLLPSLASWTERELWHWNKIDKSAGNPI